ncbi:ATP-dependent DNA helicase [Trichonephila inaurata madagascariensis]|uniref:ATP-dependent DNA helicase n=1 Tax=Trichonephila inaurata madagascariensis TaxID=2747483 RepID=A0A8X6XDF3_9ARAC|nr:ATP-dependent DNA helicase [Trichonephila inaurata madagascariensis]
MNEHPEFDIVEITHQLSIDLLNAVEITSQEDAWFLLRLPMSSSFVKVIYIATVWPTERQCVKKTFEQLNAEEIDNDLTNLWQNN